MAKRKRSHAPRRHRRRVGATKSGMMNLLMKGAGLLGGIFAGGMVTKLVPTLDPKISGGVLAAGGLYLASKARSPLIEGAGYGLAAKGGNSLLTSFGVINGIGSIPVYRGTPKLQNSVGNVMRNPIGAVKDMATIGALYDN